MNKLCGVPPPRWFGHGSGAVRGGSRLGRRWFGHGSGAVRGGSRLCFLKQYFRGFVVLAKNVIFL
jgi:hypothetical protein